MTKKALIGLAVAAFLGIGAAFAVAGSTTTGTVTACATVTSSAHTIADNGQPVYTVTGSQAVQCSTVTYTVPTVTLTSTLAATTAPATTTAASTGAYTNTSRPALTGAATVGSTLTISPGTWSPTPPGFVYSWERCSPGTWTCAPESGVSTSSTTYVVQAGDVGQVVAVNVAPVDSTGAHLWSQSAVSNQTPVVTTTSTGTTTASGSVMFDGRAKQMTVLYSHETTPGDLSTLQQGQSPNVWTGLAFLNDDIQLASDSRYGQVYAITTGINSSNPFDLPSNGRSSELSHRQAMNLGEWDWYANAYRVKSGWVQPDWAVVYQFGYPTLSSPPEAIDIDTFNGVPTFDLFQNAGLLTNNGSGFYGGTQLGHFPIVAVPFDTWVEIIVGVKWETDGTGSVRVYYRIPSQSSTWTLAISKDNIPTEQYGTTPSNSCSADYSNCPTVIDHGGLYFGYHNAPPLPSPFPTNHVDQSGLTISTDLATAEGTLP